MAKTDAQAVPERFREAAEASPPLPPNGLLSPLDVVAAAAEEEDESEVELDP
jgi:hypothetical protein